MDTAVTMTSSRETLIAEFDRVRRYTETLCSPLLTDDYQIQSIVLLRCDPTVTDSGIPDACSVTY